MAAVLIATALTMNFRKETMMITSRRKELNGSTFDFRFVGNLSAALCALFAQNTSSQPGTPDGVWSGTATNNGQQVPLRLEIDRQWRSGSRCVDQRKGKIALSSGSYSNGHLVLRFDYYANIIDAMLKGGVLTGHL